MAASEDPLTRLATLAALSPKGARLSKVIWDRTLVSSLFYTLPRFIS
jgi:hypothetical protein